MKAPTNKPAAKTQVAKKKPAKRTMVAMGSAPPKPKDVPLGDGMANNAKKALMSRKEQLEMQEYDAMYGKGAYMKKKGTKK